MRVWFGDRVVKKTKVGIIDVLCGGSILYKELREYMKVTLDTVKGSEYVSTCAIILFQCRFGREYYE